ncbi:MAG TPA: hypothetical protein PLY23_08295, partial [Alphaproteobacteria bacterium]
MKIFQRLNLRKLAYFNTLFIFILGLSTSHAMEEIDVTHKSIPLCRVSLNADTNEVSVSLNRNVVKLDTPSFFGLDLKFSKELAAANLRRVKMGILTSLNNYKDELVTVEFQRAGIEESFMTPKRKLDFLMGHESNLPEYANLVLKFAQIDRDVPGQSRDYCLNHIEEMKSFFRDEYADEFREKGYDETCFSAQNIGAWISNFGSDFSGRYTRNSIQETEFHLRKLSLLKSDSLEDRYTLT